MRRTAAVAASGPPYEQMDTDVPVRNLFRNLFSFDDLLLVRSYKARQ